MSVTILNKGTQSELYKVSIQQKQKPEQLTSTTTTNADQNKSLTKKIIVKRRMHASALRLLTFCVVQR